ncbi:MAG: hypothetical protein DRQ41_14080 [Gammaproteobacteria bacterium]|nr:MAG: hypothetical protein DRQ41_14080 [Gammaproteobacteria bacterium]
MGKQQQSGWLTTLFSIFLVLILQIIPPLVKAQNFMVLPRVTAGIMHYELEFGGEKGTSIIQDKVKLDDELPFLGVGATLVYDKFAVDAYYQTTNTADIDDNGTFLVGTSEVSYIRNTELERQDFALSFGYSFARNWSLSFGYKYGETNYDWTTDLEQDGKGETVGEAFKNNSFVAKGPFLGVGYNLPLWKGVLAFNVAAALLDGEITTSRVHKQGDSLEVKLINRNRKEKVVANAMGVTLGVNWIQPITERLSYSILLQGFKYDFNANRGVFRDSFYSDKDHEILDIDAFDVEETVYSINMSLSYRF